jgi:hypothetical protein
MERQEPSKWPRSVEHAISEGIAGGELARKLGLPPDMFEEVVKTMDRDWQNSGCEPSWILEGIVCARAAYRGLKGGN